MVPSVTLSWTFPDGSTSPIDIPPTLTFTNPGTYSTRLEVFDARGGVGTTMVVRLGPRKPQPRPPLPPSNLSVSSVFATHGRTCSGGTTRATKAAIIPERSSERPLLRCQSVLFVELPPTGPNVTSVVDTGLTEGTTYAWASRHSTLSAIRITPTPSQRLHRSCPRRPPT